MNMNRSPSIVIAACVACTLLHCDTCVSTIDAGDDCPEGSGVGGAFSEDAGRGGAGGGAGGCVPGATADCYDEDRRDQGRGALQGWEEDV